MDRILQWLVQQGLTPQVAFGTVIVLIGAAVVSLILKWSVRRAWRGLETRLKLPYEMVVTTTRLLATAVWIIAGLLILGVWGVSVGSLWTVLVGAITVVGVGFLAVWAMVSNITASVFISIWRPFRLGQTVEVLPEAVKGRVVERNMMFTVLREDAGSVLHVPNNLFFQKMFRVSHGGDPTMFEFLENGAHLSGKGAPPSPPAGNGR